LAAGTIQTNVSSTHSGFAQETNTDIKVLVEWGQYGRATYPRPPLLAGTEFRQRRMLENLTRILITDPSTKKAS
jgi:hypothetical protein